MPRSIALVLILTATLNLTNAFDVEHKASPTSDLFPENKATSAVPYIKLDELIPKHLYDEPAHKSAKALPASYVQEMYPSAHSLTHMLIGIDDTDLDPTDGLVTAKELEEIGSFLRNPDPEANAIDSVEVFFQKYPVKSETIDKVPLKSGYSANTVRSKYSRKQFVASSEELPIESDDTSKPKENSNVLDLIKKIAAKKRPFHRQDKGLEDIKKFKNTVSLQEYDDNDYMENNISKEDNFCKNAQLIESVTNEIVIILENLKAEMKAEIDKVTEGFNRLLESNYLTPDEYEVVNKKVKHVIIYEITIHYDEIFKQAFEFYVKEIEDFKELISDVVNTKNLRYCKSLTEKFLRNLHSQYKDIVNQMKIIYNNSETKDLSSFNNVISREILPTTSTNEMKYVPQDNNNLIPTRRYFVNSHKITPEPYNRLGYLHKLMSNKPALRSPIDCALYFDKYPLMGARFPTNNLPFDDELNDYKLKEFVYCLKELTGATNYYNAKLSDNHDNSPNNIKYYASEISHPQKKRRPRLPPKNLTIHFPGKIRPRKTLRVDDNMHGDTSYNAALLSELQDQHKHMPIHFTNDSDSMHNSNILVPIIMSRLKNMKSPAYLIIQLNPNDVGRDTNNYKPHFDDYEDEIETEKDNSTPYRGIYSLQSSVSDIRKKLRRYLQYFFYLLSYRNDHKYENSVPRADLETFNESQLSKASGTIELIYKLTFNFKGRQFHTVKCYLDFTIFKEKIFSLITKYGVRNIESLYKEVIANCDIVSVLPEINTFATKDFINSVVRDGQLVGVELIENNDDVVGVALGYSGKNLKTNDKADEDPTFKDLSRFDMQLMRDYKNKFNDASKELSLDKVRHKVEFPVRMDSDNSLQRLIRSPNDAPKPKTEKPLIRAAKAPLRFNRTW